MPAVTFTGRRRVKEKKAEKATNAWYDCRYPLARTKLNLQGRRGWPDQCYWIPGGQPVLFEYKADDEEPEALQTHIHKTLREHGYIVEVHTSAEKAIASLKAHIKAGSHRQ